MRYPPIPQDKMTEEQARVAAAVAARRKGGLAGPFVPLVYAPGVLDRLQMLGEFLRFDTGVPRKLLELAIIITARHVGSIVEFHAHSRPAKEFGWSDAQIAAVAGKRKPEDMSGDETAVYDFCSELHKTGRVADATFERAVAVLGKSAALELVAVCGYYAMLAMVLNVTDIPLPDGAAAAFKP